MLAVTFDLSALWSLIGKLHPVFVHFPVALITVAGLLEAWAWRKGRGPSREGMLLLFIGTVAAIASAVSGWSFASGHEPTRDLFLHRWGGIALAALALLATLLTRGGYPRRGYRPLVILLTPLVGFVGHLGGELSWGKGYLFEAAKRVFIQPPEERLIRAEDLTDPGEQHFLSSVWPILRAHCVDCHGETKQKGDLRLDQREAALAAGTVIVPGNADASDLIFLIESDFEEEQMPPPEEENPLTPEQIGTLRKWITDGAAWPTGRLPTAAAPDAIDPPRSPFSLFPVAHAEESAPSRKERDPVELFRTVVEPVLEENCVRCHGEKKQKGGLRLDRKEGLDDTDRDPRIIVPHDAAASALFERVSLPADDFDIMPPEGDPLSADEIAAIEEWIDGGAPWPEEEQGKVEENGLSADEPPTSGGGAPSATAVATVLYRATIEPVLVSRCGGCHGAQKQDGDFRVDDRTILRRVITPGDPEGSELLRRLALPAGHKDHMPREGRPVTPLEREAISIWIEAGAPFELPAGGDANRARPSRERLPPEIAAPGAVSRTEITLTAGEKSAVDRALSRLTEAGIRASRLSLTSDGVEVSTALIGSKATDATLALLGGLEPALVRLDLSGSEISDAGFATLASFQKLRVLHLGRSKIGNGALETVATLPAIEVLNLHGTAVGDQGLAALHEHPTLRRIYLWQTAVTDAAVEALAKARPKLRIIRGD